MSFKLRNHIKTNPYVTTLVYRNQKVIYFKVGRTASTMITRYVGRNYEEVSLPYFHSISRDTNDTNEILEKLKDGDAKKYFKFTVVRNPFARVVAAWKAYNRKRKVTDDFDSFILDKGVGHLRYEDGSFTNDHWFPQHYYAFYGNDVQFVDYIGKYENLKSVNKNLIENISECTSNMTISNLDAKPNYKEMFKKKSVKKKFCDIYRKDLELFDYEF